MDPNVAKADRAKAKMTLTTKLKNLKILTDKSREVDLDNAWYSVKEAMQVLEERHQSYAISLIPEGADDLTEEVEAEVDQYYEAEQTRIIEAERVYKEKRYVSAERQLREALENLKMESNLVKERHEDSKEKIDAAAGLMEKSYVAVQPLLKTASSVCPQAKEDDMKEMISAAITLYQEAKRVHADAGAVRAVEDREATEQARVERARLDSETLAASVASGNVSSASIGSASSSKSIKFKALDNPVYSGDVRDYYRWKREYADVMEPRINGASESEKLMTLKACLSAEVKRQISSTCITAADMWIELDRVFGKVQTIVSSVLEDLHSWSKPSDSDLAKQIQMIRSLERAIQDLKELGCEYEIKNQTVLDSLERKLPSKMFDRWNFHLHNQDTPVDRESRFNLFMKFLSKELAQAEYALKEVPVPKKKPERAANTRFSRQETDNSSCSVCRDQSHQIYNCQTFKSMSPAERERKVRELGLCYRCLRGGHRVNKCESRTRVCNKCDKNHNILLHDNRDRNPRSPGESQSVSTEFSQDKMSSIQAAQRLLEEAYKERDQRKIEEALKCVTRVARTNVTGGRSEPAGKTGQLLESEGVAEKPVILMFQNVITTEGKMIGALWDQASDTSYITFKLARELRLRGEPYTLIIRGVAGMETKVETHRYVLKLRTTKKQPVKFVVYGIDSVAEVKENVDMSVLARLFPYQSIESMSRPSSCDLLISLHNAGVMPDKKHVVGDLVLWEGPLGVVVGGAHEQLRETASNNVSTSRTHLALSMRTVSTFSNNEDSLSVADLNVSADVVPRCFQCLNSTSVRETKELINWFKYDQIGTACIPKCGSCRCGNCPPGGKQTTLKEEREMAQVEKCLLYRPEGDNHAAYPHWDAKYPYVEDPRNLPDNYSSVRGTFLSVEKRLDRDPEWKKIYREQIEDLLVRGAAVEITEEMKRNWSGPVWYVSHLIAPNPHSKTTPCRIVWNSSQSCEGASLNSILLKGPDVLNSLRAVLLRFRERRFAILLDIKKMYNSLFLCQEECHLHRFLWRDNKEDKIKEYMIVVVNIGDKPAGCLAMLAAQKTADLPQFSELTEAKETIVKSSYVDDVLDSFNDMDKLDEVLEDVNTIMTGGGFKLKPPIISGSKPELTESIVQLPNQIADDESRALGYGFDVERDEMYVNSTINFSKKIQKMRTGPNLTEDQIENETPELLTKREVLSQLMGTFDPSGLVGPVKMKGSILFRKIWQSTKVNRAEKVDWDQPISSELRLECISYFKELVRVSSVRFSRPLTPANWVGDPIGCTFSDGSDSAYGAVLYLRWQVDCGDVKYVVRLVESTGKLSPLDMKGDTVKSEVGGAVLATRLRLHVEQNLRVKVDKFYHFSDSKTVVAAIKKESYGYQTFFANRIGEIQTNSEPSEWFWIKGEDNKCSDLITRGASPEELDKETVWQQGPVWLSDEIENWPISQSVTEKDVMEVRKLQRSAFSCKTTSNSDHDTECNQLDAIEDLVQFSQYSSFRKLTHTYAAVEVCARVWINQVKSDQLTSGRRYKLELSDLQRARDQIFRTEQSRMDLKKLNKLVVYKNPTNQVLVTSGRFASGGEVDYTVPVLPTKSHVSLLLVLEAHQVNHDGVDVTLMRARSEVWIIAARRLVKKVVYSCVTCRRVRHETLNQIMGDLPDFRAKPSPAFMYTCLDMFGPMLVKSEVNKRSRLKVYGCVYSCLASRAIYVDILRDQGMESFLLVQRRFQAIHGVPKIQYSDQGLNFTAADKELRGFRESLSQDQLQRFGQERGMEWRFHPPDAPYANGAAEATIKIVKKALLRSVGENVLSFTELQTMFFEAAEIANERPLAVQTSDDSKIQYLCPNQLILGRSSARVPSGDFEFTKHPIRRFQLVQSLVDRFWLEWQKLTFPTLVQRKKWHTECRNLQVGDLVLIQDQSLLRGEYKLAVVVSVYPDDRGRVRQVDVLYRNIKSEPSRIYRGCKGTRLRRDVRRLVLLLPVEEQNVSLLSPDSE